MRLSWQIEEEIDALDRQINCAERWYARKLEKQVAELEKDLHAARKREALEEAA